MILFKKYSIIFVLLLASCSNSNYNQLQIHSAISEETLLKESSGYVNKPSKAEGLSVRFIFESKLGLGLYSVKATRTQEVLNTEIKDVEENNNIIDFSYTFNSDSLIYFLTLGYGLVLSGKRILDL